MYKEYGTKKKIYRQFRSPFIHVKAKTKFFLSDYVERENCSFHRTLLSSLPSTQPSAQQNEFFIFFHTNEL